VLVSYLPIAVIHYCVVLSLVGEFLGLAEGRVVKPKLCYSFFFFFMIGGNQRELARAKNAKKQASQSKGKTSGEKGGSKGAGLEKRKERDADIMREKQKKAADAKKS